MSGPYSEVWQRPAEVAAVFHELLPLADGAGWHAVYSGARVTVSRFPIVLHHWETEPSCGTKIGLHLRDLPDEDFKVDIYVVHPPLHPLRGSGRGRGPAVSGRPDRLLAAAGR